VNYRKTFYNFCYTSVAEPEATQHQSGRDIMRRNLFILQSGFVKQVKLVTNPRIRKSFHIFQVYIYENLNLLITERKLFKNTSTRTVNVLLGRTVMPCRVFRSFM
jgi:hypothetical protein